MMYDIAIVGGGASGLAAAISAKRTDGSVSVCVIERLTRVGKKILATGNGRCNLSNTDLCDSYHGSCTELLKMCEDVSVPDFFATLGVLCDDDGYGRIYPHCRSAASVLDALRLECEKLGVTEICGCEVKSIERKKAFELHHDGGCITAHSVILAGGGKSQSALGSNGSMFGLCNALGIKTVPPYPALVPLTTDPALVKPLKGQRADANVTFASCGKAVACERGEVQFTDGLLSGICVFDLSYLYARHDTDCELRLDLLPDMPGEQVTELLAQTRGIRAGAAPDDFLSGIFTRPMGIYLMRRALGGRLPEKVGKLTDKALAAVAGTIKKLTFPVTGTAGYERSQVTGGGVTADEVTETFASKRIRGLYFCGEMLDIIGDCGGCNLDFAFSSGIIAGRNAVLKK